MNDHAVPDADDDPRPVWQIAAEEGTTTAATRDLMLDHWPYMTELEAFLLVRSILGRRRSGQGLFREFSLSSKHVDDRIKRQMGGNQK